MEPQQKCYKEAVVYFLILHLEYHKHANSLSEYTKFYDMLQPFEEKQKCLFNLLWAQHP